MEDDFDPLQDPFFAQIGVGPVQLARVDQQAPVLYEMALTVRA
jgi:hypothetical protein